MKGGGLSITDTAANVLLSAEVTGSIFRVTLRLCQFLVYISTKGRWTGKNLDGSGRGLTMAFVLQFPWKYRGKTKTNFKQDILSYSRDSNDHLLNARLQRSRCASPLCTVMKKAAKFQTKLMNLVSHNTQESQLMWETSLQGQFHFCLYKGYWGRTDHILNMITFLCEKPALLVLWRQNQHCKCNTSINTCT